MEYYVKLYTGTCAPLHPKQCFELEFFFQSNLGDSKRFSKKSCAVDLTVFASTRIKYNSLLVGLVRLQI